MLKVMTVLGTRPEAIKLAPVIRRLASRPDRIASHVCVTGQHRRMLDQVLARFDLAPDSDLDLMTASQTPTGVAARALAGLEPLLEAERPDWVLVQGDTTTTAAAALAASLAGLKVAHVEAGLRTGDRRRPFPEELNRRVVGAVADLHLAPTPRGRDNLLAEGVPAGAIRVTGNTGIDALFALTDELGPDPQGLPWAQVPPDARIVMATTHRRESLGEPMERICRALRDVVRGHDDVHLVLPVHPRPEVGEVVRRVLEGEPRVILCEPLDYADLLRLLLRSDLVITDSGGLQEESPSLGKPVVVLREVTERPEAVEAGIARLVGTDRGLIVEAAAGCLATGCAAGPVLCYGDGRAADRIVSCLLGDPVEEWQPDVPQGVR
jgi:UDP-N-acetylglucosamine 2-epimerase